MTEFEREFKKLNKKQRQATEYIDGPLLVIAGPGTGKTQLLSLRVANILKQTDTSPENILCLTFTNKAANNMRQRLSSLAGPAGNRVPIRTFHSFAAELMTLYPEYFWNGARLSHVPDAVQLEIITDILSKLPLDNPLALKFAGQFTATSDVQQGLRLAKEAGLTPNKLRALIELNLSYIDILEPRLADILDARLTYKRLDELAGKIEGLPDQSPDRLTRPLISLATVIRESFAAARAADEGTGKTTNVSKWKSRWLNTVNGQKGMFDERKRNAWWLSLADVYESYRTLLHNRGYYDYADMIIEVITQLENSAELLAGVQERYSYVLIDEFQDTNAAQLRLAHLVADHHTAEGAPNIMAVGDDDQAIYKFQGANLSNMKDFRRSYPAAETVVLTDNYRSSQPILDFSGKLINQAAARMATEDSGVKKQLTAKNEPEQKSRIEHLSYPARQHQYYGIAKEIARAHADGGSTAVLARGHESLRTIAAVLEAQDIPIRYEQQQSILDQEAVRQIVLVAEAIQALGRGQTETVNTKVAQLLPHPVWDIQPETLWQLAIKNHYAHDWITSLMDSGDPRLEAIANWLLWLSRESSGLPLPRMLEYIIGLKTSEHLTSPIRQYFLHIGNEDTGGADAGRIDTPFIAALSGVHKLLDLAGEFSRHGQATLADFVRLINLSRDNNQTITDESLFVNAPDAVELLTVHKAKGLEFDNVFIIDAQDSVWRPVSSGRKPPANLPLKPAGDELDDYIRLMFVAATRARRNIYIASYDTNGDGQPVLASGIIRDLLPAGRPTVKPADTLATLEQTLAWPRLADSQEKLLLARTLENFTLSATALLNFLDVTRGGPSYFLGRHMLKLPEATTPQAAFGRAVHAALEKAQQLARENNFTLEEIIGAYEIALKEQFLSSAEFDRYLDYGRTVLRRLFKEHGFSLSPDGRPEVKLSDIYIGPARLRGDLDLVELNQGQLLITDYKTGSPLTNLFSKNKTLELKAWRHRTQLQFYSLLAQESREFKAASSISARMLYVQAENPKDLIRKYTPSTDELDRLGRLLPIVWYKITCLILPDTGKYVETQAGLKCFYYFLLDGCI